MQPKIIKYENYEPKIERSVYIASSAVIIGNTSIKENSYIDNKVVIRGDGEHISIGKNCILKPRTTVHVAADFLGTKIEDNCIIEQYSIIHACEIGSGVLIGENSVIMDGSKIGKNSIIMPDTLVPPGKVFGENSLIYGSPGKVIKKVDKKLYRTIFDNHSNKLNNFLISDFNYKGFIRDIKYNNFNGIQSESNVFIAPDVEINCKLKMDKNSSIWFATLLSSKNNKGTINLGKGSNIQDNSIINTSGQTIDIGKRVTIGHNVIINGNIKIENDVVIGMGSIIQKNCHFKKNAFIGANSYVKENTTVPEGDIYAGKPAKFFRKITNEEKKYFSLGQKIYEKLTKNYSAI